MPTIATDPKVLGEKYTRTFNSHDEVALKNLYAESAKFVAPGDVRISGRDAIAGYTNNWMKALPDARINVTHEIVSGAWLVQEFTFSGVHTGPLTGPLGTIQATNRKVTGQCVVVNRFENDLIVESRLYFDMVQLLTQIGVMPAVISKN
ncbi:MAG: ester cyclase [Candidatus Dormibacteraeota bacterium]|nr:ester cyclase [Candidatus Dormibacteraeota bacterium]